ncbi:hypothetical protein D3C81_1616120 [compost metagenome]
MGQALAAVHGHLLRLELLEPRVQVSVVVLLLLLQRIHRVLEHLVLTAQAGHLLPQTFELVLHVELGLAVLVDALGSRCLETVELVPQRDHGAARLVVVEDAGVRGRGCQQAA